MQHEEKFQAKLVQEQQPKIFDLFDRSISEAFSKLFPSNIKDKTILRRIEKLKAEMKEILASL